MAPSTNGTAAPRRLLGPGGQPIDDDEGMLLPHYSNFAAIWNAFNQTYSYRYDEALAMSYENAMAMRRDPFIWACLDERYRGVTQLPWQIEPEDEEDQQQKEVANQLTKIVTAIPKLSSLFRNLEEMVWYGRYGVQIQPGVITVNDKPQTGVVYHRPVNGDKIQCDWDGTPAIMISPTKSSEYKSRGYKVMPGERAPLIYLDRPELRERFLISTFERDDADYFQGEMAGQVAGVGIRSRIYYHWNLRSECLGWALNYFRKVGTLGLLIFPFADGNPESEAAAKVNIQQAGNRSALAMPVPAGQDPKNYAPFVLSPSTAGIDSLMAMIDSYWERHMERYIVGQNMSDGKDNDSGLGGSGRAEFAAGSAYLKIKGDADMLGECLTTDLLKPLHRWNYPGERFTYKFVFGVTDPKAKDRMEAASALVAMGVSLRVDDVREIGGFNKPNEGDETIGGVVPGGPNAPFGVDKDGLPNKTEPMPEKAKGDEKPERNQRDETPDLEREDMNDKQFAIAMERLARIEERMIDRQQQNYARSNDDAVALIRDRLEQMQRYQAAPQGSPITLQMQPAQIEGLDELVAAIREMKAPEVHNHNQVNVPPANPTPVTVEAPSVTVQNTIPTPSVTVENKVETPSVTVQNNIPPAPPEPEFDIVPERGPDGRVEKFKRVKKGKS